MFTKINTEAILAILLSSGLSVFIFVLFRGISKKNLNLKAIIVWNYLICIVVGNVAIYKTPVYIGKYFELGGTYGVLALGSLFMFTFLFMGKATADSGPALSAVASKMSMAIPILVALVFFYEKVNASTLIGMLVALLSVFFITYKPGGKEASINLSLLAVFIGSGLVDTGMNWVKYHSISDWNNMQMAVLTFTGAAFTGMGYLWHQKELFLLKSLPNFFWGSLLGTVNLFSIFAVYHGLDLFSGRTSLFFTLNNLAVVILTFLVGVLMKDELNNRAYLGLFMAIIALFLLV